MPPCTSLVMDEKPKKRKYTKQEISTIRDINDGLFAKQVKENASMVCEKCGKERILHTHHFYSRANYSTRWDYDNGFCLCSGCHILSSTFSAHKTPAEFVEWCIEYRGQEWYDNLRQKYNTYVKRGLEFNTENMERLKSWIPENSTHLSLE
ncbi:hypothetical protein ACFL4H_00315 [Candidatus Neomarinimicrobiota bacterium]